MVVAGLRVTSMSTGVDLSSKTFKILINALEKASCSLQCTRSQVAVNNHRNSNISSACECHLCLLEIARRELFDLPIDDSIGNVSEPMTIDDVDILPCSFIGL